MHSISYLLQDKIEEKADAIPTQQAVYVCIRKKQDEKFIERREYRLITAILYCFSAQDYI